MQRMLGCSGWISGDISIGDGRAWAAQGGGSPSLEVFTECGDVALKDVVRRINLGFGDLRGLLLS